MPARFPITAVLSLLAVMPAIAHDRPVFTMAALSCLPWCELERIYRAADPGAQPTGFYRGHVVYPPCEKLVGPRERLANFFWQGKHFCDTNFVNQWRGVRLIKGERSAGDSWLDGRPAHILNYQHTSRLWSDVRDEAREVSPGVYLGVMYLRRCPEPRAKVMFILEAECR